MSIFQFFYNPVLLDWNMSYFHYHKTLDFDSIFPQLATQQGYQLLLPNYNRSPTFFKVR